MKNLVSFQFSGDLLDFLSGPSTIAYRFNGSPSVKDAIEAIGVPHTEIGSVKINASSANLSHLLKHGDFIEILPITGEDYRNNAPAQNGFIADVHLGSLTKQLRMLGFDVLFNKELKENEIAHIAAAQERIVISRSVNLFKYKIIEWGYWIRSENTNQQLHEVITRFNLLPEANPFSRCLVCNGLIHHIPRASIENQLPADTRKYFNDFWQCENCKRIYWKGSHYEHMQQLIERLRTEK